MKLIFERNMLNPDVGTMVRYFTQQDIFAAGPSGLSPAIAAVVGGRALLREGRVALIIDDTLLKSPLSGGK